MKVTQPLSSVPDVAIWLTTIAKYYGTHEQPMPGVSNPLIVQWLADVGLPGQPDLTAWCSAFANAVIRECGLNGTGKANARSWEDWGTRLDKPRFGCITVLWRDSASSGLGHVGFWLGNGPGASFHLVGGNEQNAVSTQSYLSARLLSFRWPDASCLPVAP